MSSPPTPQMVLAPYYFGVVLNTMLYGVLLVQAVIYYQGYKNDRPWLRYFVLYLLIVETANTGICVAMIYEPLISQFGTESPMLLFPSLLPSQPFLETAISVPVQFFYAWRIYVILGSYYPPGIICLSSLGSVAGAYWTAINVHRAHTYLDKALIDHPALIWSVCAAGSDVIITVSLITSLINKKTGMKPTDDAINRILRNTLQTGAITGMFAVLDIVLFLALPNSTLSFVFDFALPKIYSNALISTLNARGGIGTGMTTNLNSSNVLGQVGGRSTTAGRSVVFHNSHARTEFIEMNSDILSLDASSQDKSRHELK